MRIDDYLLTTGVVAKLLGVCDERVRQLDDELKPQFAENGQRRYRLVDVQTVAKRRAAVRSAR